MEKIMENFNKNLRLRGEIVKRFVYFVERCKICIRWKNRRFISSNCWIVDGIFVRSEKT